MKNRFSFWKTRSRRSDPPGDIDRALRAGEYVEGLDPLPTDEMLWKIEQAFAGWTRDDRLRWSQGPAGFDLMLTEQSLHVECRDMEGDAMNRLIDIGAAFDCPLYDADLDQRFD